MTPGAAARWPAEAAREAHRIGRVVAIPWSRHLDGGREVFPPAVSSFDHFAREERR